MVMKKALRDANTARWLQCKKLAH